MHDGEGESSGDCSIDSIAAFAENLYSRIGSEMMHADHHAMAGAHRLFAAVRDCVSGCLLRRGSDRRGRYNQRNDGDESGSESLGMHGFGQDNSTRNGGIAELLVEMRQQESDAGLEIGGFIA